MINGFAPKYLTDNIIFTSDIHKYYTRSQLSVSTSSIGSQGKKSFHYTGLKLWNSLPYNIKCIDDLIKYKKAIKSYLFEKLVQSSTSQFVYF